ncbi:transporter substrate-binding domain-containing protein [Geomonas propionica]|uniref:histidine kinase n=1 Tax=Geomonas propionica TaxID=2798582 RepID=A0ABS0YPA4_9BACT|nr:transporter substrate-binding domain-containing protein [Geomonas propionica]MBJ6799811.1 transporter substrate-binding domain-containing protein [Geomonas propionica]
MSGIILLLLFLSCSLAFATGDPLGVGDALPETTTIKVGGNRAYPPYEFLDRNGQPAGFTVDLIRSIAEVMGVNADIQLGEWSKVREDLEAGRIDMTLGMSHTGEREEVYDYPSPHAIVQHAIFARRETPPAGSLEELRGKKVVVFRGGVMNEKLKALGYEKDLVLTKTAADALRLLASGQNDYAVVALLPGMYIIRENKLTNLVPVARNIATFKFSFAVRQGNHELQSQLNEGLAILKKNGEYQAIYDKWLGVLEPRRISWEKAIQYGSMILVPLVLLLTGTFAWSRMLKKKVDERAAELALEVSEKERAWDELRVQQDKLVQADKMASLGILVSGVAHEINNPNGLILLSMPILRESQAAVDQVLEEYCKEHGDFMCGRLPYSRMRDKLPGMLAEIHEGAKRIKRIVDDLKDFARQNDAAGMEPFDLNQVVQAAVRLMENSIRKATHNFVVTCAEDLPMVRGNAQRIEQVVVNLILNSCQALPDKGRGIFVTTYLDCDSGRVLLQVRDEGTGVAPEHLSHLTDPFFTTKRDTGGTGLGLSISAGIIKEHGGLLSFDSVPGAGTTVTLTLLAA